MDLKEKLEALGFKETYFHGQYLNRDLSVYVYIRYNKITDIQISKTWELKQFNNYTEYLNKVNPVISKVESIKKEREEARYNGLINEANSKLNDAQQEYDSNKAEVDKVLYDA